MTEPEGDPTAEFLAAVRPGDTPWRTDRPESADGAGEKPAEKSVGDEGPPGRWRTAGRVAGEAAPYVQAALFAAWIATSVADSDVWGTDQSG